MVLRGGLVALLLAACGAPPAPAPGTLWTAADLLRLRNGAVARGEPLKYFSSPYAAGTAVNESGWEGFEVFPSFSEGQPAAYVTTEIWKGFPEVWVQPLYVPVDANGVRQQPVFAVDATSRFYSPYWQIYTFPSDKPDGYWTSAKQILDANVPLTEGPGKFCAIVPDEMRIARPQGGKVVRPLTGEDVGDAGYSEAWADGHKVWYLDLGVNRFTWNEDYVVDETALYHFAIGGVEADVPSVGGVGGPPPTATRVQFGSLWRIFRVELPSTADVLVPASNPGLRAYMISQGFAATVPTAAVEAAGSPLKIAANGKQCFGNDAIPCVWLDSESQLMTALPAWRIVKTDVLASCPLLLFKGTKYGMQP